ncbi:MAG: hypothetical protein MPW14_10795 [Candidatus Manganitrophus sp.]|nr:MAG: hypothetical protein MPW14_10795 [Candidatus Manganitrophus sp.]
MEKTYQPKEIEAHWQAYWRDRQTFKAVEDPVRPKFYCLEMFPYPSAAEFTWAMCATTPSATSSPVIKRMRGQKRAAADGLGRLRPARRKRRHPK